MFNVYAVEASNRAAFDKFVEQQFRIRHDIYVGERQWLDLARPDGREVDAFDVDDAVYLLGIQPGKGVVAGSRLVPTLRPHLLSDVFPELASGRIPRAPDIYEWTRIFVTPELRTHGHLSLAAGIIYCAIVEFCLLKGIRKLSIVCETYWIERLSTLGWRPRQLAAASQHEGMEITALLVEMDEPALAQTRLVYSVHDPVLRVVDEVPRCLQV